MRRKHREIGIGGAGDEEILFGADLTQLDPRVAWAIVEDDLMG
jgi:hypothetical protein